MTAIHHVPSDHKMAWRGGDFTKDDIAFDLTARHAAALEDVLLRLRRKALAEITPEDCRHPALDADLEKVFDELQDGRGIVIVRGIPVEGLSVEDAGRLFWALGAHFGRGVSQSAIGDVLGYVRDETPPGGEESARGYTSRRELSLHTDLGQIVGLACVRQARTGGHSQYAAALAIHCQCEISRRRGRTCQVAGAFYRGFPYHSARGEQGGRAAAPITLLRHPRLLGEGRGNERVFHGARNLQRRVPRAQAPLHPGRNRGDRSVPRNRAATAIRDSAARSIEASSLPQQLHRHARPLRIRGLGRA